MSSETSNVISWDFARQARGLAPLPSMPVLDRIIPDGFMHFNAIEKQQLQKIYQAAHEAGIFNSTDWMEYGFAQMRMFAHARYQAPFLSVSKEKDGRAIKYKCFMIYGTAETVAEGHDFIPFIREVRWRVNSLISRDRQAQKPSCS